MRSLNRVFLLGNLTQDAELRFTVMQVPMLVFTLAADVGYDDGTGKTKNETCYVVCEVFGVRARAIKDYLRRGKRIVVDGILRQEKWSEKKGRPRSRHVVVAENVIFWESSDPQHRD